MCVTQARALRFLKDVNSFRKQGSAHLRDPRRLLVLQYTCVKSALHRPPLEQQVSSAEQQTTETAEM